MIKRRKLKKKSLKEMKNLQRNGRIFLFILLLFAIVFIFAIFFFVKNIPDELVQGESASDFCIKKCPINEYYSSINNSDYNFIRCDCVGDIIHGDGKYFRIATVVPVVFYYDSLTLEKISKESVLERIK